MRQLYTNWLRTIRIGIWFIVTLGLLASLPLAGQRMVVERSAQNVEIVLDYRDLLRIASIHPNAVAYVEEQMAKFKPLGVTSLAIYETTLDELTLTGKVDLYESRNLPITLDRLPPPEENYTYVRFANQDVEAMLRPLIEAAFAHERIPIKPWTIDDAAGTGMVIQAPLEYASTVRMDPDPIELGRIVEHGYQPVVRLSNNRPFNDGAMNKLLIQLQQYGVKRVIFSGDAMTGYAAEPKGDHIETMGLLLRKYGMGIALIEQPLSKLQKGSFKMTDRTGYNAVRLHSLSERDSTEPEDKLADRIALAVKDRNMRMIFLHAIMQRNPISESYINTLNNLEKALGGTDEVVGASERIERMGFTLGPAEPFDYPQAKWQRWLKLIAAAGAVAVIALTIAEFIPVLLLPAFLLGLFGMTGLYVLSPAWLLKLLALGVGICAPTMGLIKIAKYIRDKRSNPADGQSIHSKLQPSLVRALGLFIVASLFSMLGAAYVVGLLSQHTFSLMLDQFRGVSLLHSVPIVLVGLYLLFFWETGTMHERIARAGRILTYKVNVLIAVVAAAGAVLMWYYLSRTGNEGQASSLEKTFRSLLENTLGVRPRTKEVLLHPVLLLGAYAAIRYRQAIYLFVIGAIAQLSVVDTFAHLHTPLTISLIRVGYGLLFGTIVALIVMIIWKIVRRGFHRWAPFINKL